MTFDQIAGGVVEVNRGGSLGSGFHLGAPDIVVTNAHVIDHGTGAILASTEDYQQRTCSVLAQSPEDDEDWAILRLESPFDGPRTMFRAGERPVRGADLAFAGYPHGTGDLLVHKATMSGPCGDLGFYLDASINGGNSGGPVVDPNTGSVVGIVTARRYMHGPEMESLAREAGRLRQHSAAVGGGVDIMGIDFTALTGMIGTAFELIERVALLNANSGIGVGYYIEHVLPHLPA